MEKKLILVLLMVTLLAGGVFAQGMSVGFGLLAVPSFDEYKYDVSGMSPIKHSRFGIGANAFFDATFVEINVGLLFGNYKSDQSGDEGQDLTEITLGLVGKYPVSVSNDIVFFPFVGIDYNINLEAKDVKSGKKREDDQFGKDKNGNDYTRADVLSNLSILLGIGLDLGLTDAMYLRAEAGYGIVLNNKSQKDQLDNNSKLTITQGKIPIKVALGFNF